MDSQGDVRVVDGKGNVSGSSLKNGSIESRDSEIVNAYSGFEVLLMSGKKLLGSTDYSKSIKH
ncbi:MAG TPA: hypothetical protein VKZ95_01100 [Sphingobacteriaceae bacterium]|nr:hypothetical protein [Sphingobacteriaceae bacterium]